MPCVVSSIMGRATVKRLNPASVQENKEASTTADRGEIVVVGRHGAALKCMEHFGGVKAEDLRVAETANHTPLVRAAEGVCGVEEQVKVPTLDDFFQAPGVTGPAPEMGANDSRGPVVISAWQ